MSSISPGVLTRELSENTAWLRRVARALVGEAAADDLVQDTMEVALQRPPDTDRPVRPWLRTVLRNAARMHRRASVRREHREEHATRPPEPEPPDASLTRLETQRRVVQAVLALDEPYRQAVVLRYVDDLSAAEIARKLEVPAATIRSRLRRGLAMLRQALERQDGQPHWKLALAPFVVPGNAASAATPIAIGALIMKAAAAAIVVIAAVVLTVTVARSTQTSSEEQAATEVPPPGVQHRAPMEETARPAIAAPGPRRFRHAEDRERFAQALAVARRRAGERPIKTYDYSGVRVPPAPSAASRGELPGKLDKHYIRERIAEIVPLVRECYELALVHEPALSGRLTVDFEIEAEEEVGGYVREATIAEDSELRDPALSECVTETILSVEFIPPEGGGVVRVRYPFLFEQDAE